MAEVKVEAACEGESVQSERYAGSNPPATDNPAGSETSLMQDELTKASGEILKAPSISVETESKDFPGPESIIPLSPQWLFSKHGDGKQPMTPIDLPQAPASANNGNNNDVISKERWRPEVNRDADKRRDWWRTMATEGDGSVGNRRERWREDERESSLLGRRDRWKEGGDSTDKRVDRWAENSLSAKESVESRRTQQSDRRSDSASRETSYETRRDSKWNTRWGPEDKEKENRRDKRLDLEKEGEGHRDKQQSSTHRNEIDKEVDTSARDRWRPHSITARSKGEMPAPLSSPSPKAAPGFGIGRGRGDTMPAGFAIGRGRANLSGVNPLHGMFSSIGSPAGIERGDGGSGFRYPRAKLLDIYRKCSASFSNKKYPEGFSEAPQLTQADPFEPLAFFTPDMDEEVVLEGILKGDLLTSGAAHAVSKEQTSNKPRENSGWNRSRGRTIGSKEEGLSEASRENLGLREDSKAQNGFVQENDSSVAMYRVQASGDASGAFSVKEVSDASLYSPTASESYKQKSMLELKESKNLSKVLGNHESGPSSNRAPASSNRAPAGKGQDNLIDLGGNYDENSEVLDKLASLHLNQNSEGNTWSHSESMKRNLSSQIAAEELSLCYIDPQGAVQGPFSGVDIIDWCRAGFFGTDLMVRTADSPESAPFTQLSKIMPHLQATTQVLSAAGMLKDDLEYQESNDRATKVSSTSQCVQQPVMDSSGRSMRVGNIQAEGLFSASGWNVEGKDLTVGKVSEHERATTISDEAAMLKRSSSLPQRTAGLPQIQKDDLQSVLQHWSERGMVHPGKSGFVPRHAVHPSSRVEFLHGGPELFLTPGGSTPLERSWSDMSSATETPPLHLPSHGLDALHMHQLQQLQMQRVLQELDPGVPLSHVLQQQQHLNQQLAEHLLSSGHVQHDLSPHSLQQLLNPRMPPRLQHQHSFPVQAPEATLDQLLRLHQQQQAPSQVHLEQLLRQHQQLPVLDHLHGSPLLTERQLRRLQEASRTDNQAQQMEQLRHRHAHDSLLQRQLEHQARQHALLVQQAASLHGQRISGVWEVDEFGQFMQTPASNPMHPLEALHQQPPQRHQSFSHVQHLGASHGVSGGHNSQQRLSRSELRKLADLEMQKNLASLLDGTTSMPEEMLAQLQNAIARFEAQNLSTPENSSFEPQIQSLHDLQNQALLNGEALTSRAWNTGNDFGKQQVKEMLNRGVSGSSMFDQLSAKSELPVPGSKWQHDSFSLQADLNRRSGIFASSAGERIENALRPHNRPEKLADQAVSEDLLGVLSSHSLSSHSFSGKRGNVPSNSFRDQQVMSNLWTGKHTSLESDSSSVHPRGPQPPLFERASSFKSKHWDMDWTNTDMNYIRELPVTEGSKIPFSSGHDLPGIVGEVRIPTPPLSHEGGRLMRPSDPRDGVQHGSYLNNDDVQSAASFLRSGSVRAEDLREVLPSRSSHLLGDAQQAWEDNACSRLAVWSSDVKTEANTLSALKEINEVPRTVRNEFEGVPLALQGQRQANNKGSSVVSVPAGAVTWQRAPSPSLTKSPAPAHHGTIMRSTTPGDDEFFWDYNAYGNARQLSRAECHEKLFSQREQFGKAPDEGFANQPFASGPAHMPGSEFSSAVRPMQPSSRGILGSKQAGDVPALNPQGSLTIADAKAFREWCEEQISLRRGLNESTADYLENGPAFEALKAEFLRHKDSIPLEAMHAETFAGEKTVAMETGTSGKPKKNSEGEEEPDSELSGQSSAVKSAKKKAKKGKKVVDPSLLGFSVASNRILMGEIQHVDD